MTERKFEYEEGTVPREVEEMPNAAVDALTDEDIERYRARSRAEVGAPLRLGERPAEPALPEVDDVPRRQMIYEVNTFRVYFDDREKAREVADLMLALGGKKVHIGDRYNNPEVFRPFGADDTITIGEEKCYTEEDAVAQAARIGEADRIKKIREAAKKEHEEAIKEWEWKRDAIAEADESVDGIIRSKRRLLREVTRLRESLAEYVEVAGGDRAQALKFFLLAMRKRGIEYLWRARCLERHITCDADVLADALIEEPGPIPEGWPPQEEQSTIC